MLNIVFLDMEGTMKKVIRNEAPVYFRQINGSRYPAALYNFHNKTQPFRWQMSRENQGPNIAFT